MTKKRRKPQLSDAGVEGSVHRDLIEEMEGWGFTLRAIFDADHPSKVRLVFTGMTGGGMLKEPVVYTTITIEDTMEMPGE